MIHQPPSDPLCRLALAYAPSSRRRELAALWSFDETLGRVVSTTSEPMLGQMRLTWWHEQVSNLDQGKAAAEPVIAALAEIVSSGRLSGEDLARLVEGWEALLEPLPLDEATLDEYAAGRGGELFAMSARLLNGAVDVALGEGWALIDFAEKCSDATTAERAWTLARQRLAAQLTGGPKSLRILARIAATKAKRPVSTRGQPITRWQLLHAVLP